MIKSVIKRVINRFGFDLIRRSSPDLGLYDEFPRESLIHKRFYNIGSGLFHHPYWTNIDYTSEHYSVVQRHPFIHHDLMELAPLPIEDQTAEIIYSSHTIEHVSDEAVFNLLKETYRVLRPNGHLRLTTPDMNLSYDAYMRQDIGFWYWRDWYSRPGTWEQLFKMPLCQASIPQLFLCQFASELSDITVAESEKKYSDDEILDVFSTNPMEEAIDYFAGQCSFNPNYPGSHISWWTHDKLLSFLRAAGFSQGYMSGYGQSQSPPLRDTDYFDNTHPRVSLYVEAER